MFYGAPASGILCVELLKGRSTTTTLPRSETIQNLTIFVAFLAWVQPSPPNADLCGAIKSIISRVLDQVLDEPMESEGADGADILNSWDFDLPLWDNVGSLDLLDTYDYFRAL